MKKTNLNGLFPEAKKKIKKIKTKSNELKSKVRNKNKLSLKSLEQRLTKPNLNKLEYNYNSIGRFAKSMKNRNKKP